MHNDIRDITLQYCGFHVRYELSDGRKTLFRIHKAFITSTKSSLQPLSRAAGVVCNHDDLVGDDGATKPTLEIPVPKTNTT